MPIALRQLAKSPGFAVIAILTLGLGIGVNTSMFSVLNAVLLRTLPYAEPDTLVRVYRTSPQSQRWPHSPANFLDYQARNPVFEKMAAVRWTNYSLAEPGQPAERLRGLEVTADFFPILGVPPALGRVFSADEDKPGQDKVIVLSHTAWVSRFARDPHLVGRTLRINGEPVTVIGVMPPGFDERMLWHGIDAWRPLAFTDEQRQTRGTNYLNAIARLKPGVSLPQAQAAMNALAGQLAQEYPQNNSQTGVRLLSLTKSAQDESGQQLTWFVTGLAGFVLLIACANLANLQFARTASRAREYAIRAALGASRLRLIRELLTESVLLALAGGALGLLLAVWCNDVLSPRIIIAHEPGLALPLDWRVFGFAFAASVATGIAFGLLPALLASRASVADALKQGSRGASDSRAQHRLRHALIVAEVALALVLLSGAGFFMRGLQQFTQRDPGWQPDGLLTGYVALPGTKYSDATKRRALADELQERLAALPGVGQVAVAQVLPTWGFSGSSNFLIEGRTVPERGREPLFNVNSVSPAYFATLGMKVVAGRNLNSTDLPDGPQVIIINEAAARALWPGEDPIGKRLGSPGDEPNWREIIGVVNDVHAPAILTPPDTRFQVYRSLAQVPSGYLTLALRADVPPETLANDLRRAVAAIDPDQPVHDISTVRAEIDSELANMGLVSWLLGGFALLGVMLAAIGIYGVITGYVVQRTNEIGIRLALGAQLRDILALVLGKGLRLALLGGALGLTGAIGVARLLQAISSEIPAAEPITALAATAFLLAIATFACWLPARRATRVDPMIALRAE